MIIYRPGKDNTKADILSRREQDLEPSRELKAYLRTKALLQPDQVDLRSVWLYYDYVLTWKDNTKADILSRRE